MPRDSLDLPKPRTRYSSLIGHSKVPADRTIDALIFARIHADCGALPHKNNNEVAFAWAFDRRGHTRLGLSA
jgi:hypothetical protein